jgi:HlyD family secretion protein
MARENKKYNLFRRILQAIVIAVVIGGAAVWGYGYFRTDEDSAGNMPTFKVKRGPLKISVTETGSIQAREKIIVKSEVEGMTSIIFLVEEGTRAKKGDLLVELDTSKLLDKKIDQEIRVQNAEASYISARENLAVVKNQAQSDNDRAQLTDDFALQDLEKYLKGEYPNQLKEAESRITLAEEELARAQEKLTWSKKLFEEKYISQTELQVDKLSEKKKKLDLELARNDLNLLKNYTHKRSLAQLESDVKQAKMALDRIKRKARADILQAEANLKAKEAEFGRQKDKLEKTERQIVKTKMYAPVDGLVIYATSASSGGRHWRRREPLAEGGQVRERQELIHLPTDAGYNAEIGVYEASLNKVRKGLPAVVTIDALPGEVYRGRVVFIAPLPDAQSAFLNPDLKVYKTVIELDGNGNTGLLRAGMNCTVDIIVEQYKEATYIPVQAVLRVGGYPTVYVVKGNKLEPRKIEIGLDNNSMIRTISGLEPGELVSLTPPLNQASIEEPGSEEVAELPSGPIDKSREGSGPTPSQGAGRSQVSDPQAGSNLSPSQSGMLHGGGSRSAASFMSRFDRDKDNKVSKEEFPGPDQVFDRLDKDSDGFITKSEVPAAPPRGTGGFQGSRSSSGASGAERQ